MISNRRWGWRRSTDIVDLANVSKTVLDCGLYKIATFISDWRPILLRHSGPHVNRETGMDEHRIASDRADIEERVAHFKETQARFQRERDAYYESTIEKVRTIRWNEMARSRLSR